MDFKSNYPYVFVNGLFGYGPDSKLDQYLPYFGSSKGSIINYFEENGLEAYEASVGPLSSAWDRACELYAELTGTTVDYGKAHSERTGHERFGRTYLHPLVEGLGKPMPNGGIKKINLIGHSFGGTTARMLACLLDKGCEAERQATPEAELSPLFKGGLADMIFSITTCASPHNGMTLFDSLGEFGEKFERFSFRAANTLANTPISKLYDFKLDQFGLTTDPFLKTKASVDPAKAEKMQENKDTAYYDLSVKGAKEVNKYLYCVPSIYYFSYAAKKTKKCLTSENQKARRNSWLPYKITSSYIGCYDIDKNRDIYLDSRWFENDGVVNTYSSIAPFNEPATDFNMVTNIRTGIWYKMGTLDMAHTEFCGHNTDLEVIDKFYLNHALGINKLANKA